MRDAVAAEIASNAILIRWVVYLSGVTTGASALFILARRANLYAEMLKMLKSSALDDPGSTLMVLLGAACCESHCGNLTLAYKHWVGVLALVKSHLGGARAVQKINFAKAMALVEGVLMQHVPLFESKAKLFEAMDKLSIPRARVPIDRKVRKFFGSECARVVGKRRCLSHCKSTSGEYAVGARRIWEVYEGVRQVNAGRRRGNHSDRRNVLDLPMRGKDRRVVWRRSQIEDLGHP